MLESVFTHFDETQELWLTTAETEMGLELYNLGGKNAPVKDIFLFSLQQEKSSPIFTYLFIDSFTEDGKQEDSSNGRPKVARNCFYVMKQLSILRHLY